MSMDRMPMGSGPTGTMDSTMLPMMRAHMDSMARLPSDRMASMLAAHDQRMSQMMDRMGTDMRRMRMSGDPMWNALSDSVRADLAELPALHGRELAARMKAHVARVERLMTLHEDMTKGM